MANSEAHTHTHTHTHNLGSRSKAADCGNKASALQLTNPPKQHYTCVCKHTDVSKIASATLNLWWKWILYLPDHSRIFAEPPSAHIPAEGEYTNMDAHNTHYHISACVHVFGNDLKLASWGHVSTVCNQSAFDLTPRFQLALRIEVSLFLANL